MKVPSGYSALVVEGGNSKSDEIKLKATKKLDKITVWNYDKPGAHREDNPVSKAFQWLEIAGVVAGDDTDDEEKENESRKRKRS